MPIMKTVSREVLKELFVLFVVTLLIFMTFLFLGKMLKLKSLLLSFDLSAGDIIELFVYISPFFLVLLIPVGAMTSVFLTFQRMSLDRELMSLRTGGVSLFHILPVSMIFLLSCMSLNFLISFYGISWGMNKYQSYLFSLVHNKIKLSLQPGVFNQDLPGFMIYAENVAPDTKVLEGIFVQDKSRKDSNLTIIAPRGRIIADHDKGKIYFFLQDGKIYRPNQGEMNILQFSNYKISFDIHNFLEQMDIHEESPMGEAWLSVSWNKLNKMIQNQSNHNQDRKDTLRELKVERQRRVALPIACLVLGFLAFPLGWLFEGVKRHYGIFIIVGVFLVYYALFTFSMSLGEKGLLGPILAVWSPNFLFIILAFVLFYFSVRENVGISFDLFIKR